MHATIAIAFHRRNVPDRGASVAFGRRGWLGGIVIASEFFNGSEKRCNLSSLRFIYLLQRGDVCTQRNNVLIRGFNLRFKQGLDVCESLLLPTNLPFDRICGRRRRRRCCTGCGGFRCARCGRGEPWAFVGARDCHHCIWRVAGYDVVMIDVVVSFDVRFPASWIDAEVCLRRASEENTPAILVSILPLKLNPYGWSVKFEVPSQVHIGPRRTALKVHGVIGIGLALAVPSQKCVL